MGVLIDGEWDPDRDQLVDEKGTFVRSPTTFRNEITEAGDHPPAKDRYHLYISRACPWAHRTMLVRGIMGLEETISVNIVDPVRINDGWEFTPEKDDCTPDTVNGCSFLRDVYTRADPTYSGRVTVPVLWDRETGTMVNNESSDIIRLLATSFDRFASNDVELYPPELPVSETIDEIYESINNGVYKAGFATSQAAYDDAVAELFEAIATWDRRLADQRYVCGDRLTAADLCLFPTLYRFDEVYHTHFKCNHRRIVEYDNLWGHTREIYQLPGVAETCNMDHCKLHYYHSHQGINPQQIVPIGPDPPFNSPHDRDRLPGDSPVPAEVPSEQRF